MTMSDQRLESRHDLLLDYNGWLFWREASDQEQQNQLAYQRSIAERSVTQIGESTFLSERAMVAPDVLTIGARSYVAAHAYLTGTIVTGDDCTINVFAVVRGRVTLGDGVRIGAHTSILGFNHSLEPDRPVFRQPIVEKGIVIGDDVWIGSNAVILDGVTIGSHAVIAAGAVVTRDVADWAIVGGNPARLLRDRRVPKSTGTPHVDLARRLEAFADGARAEADAIIARSWEPDSAAPDGSTLGRYVDAPGSAPSLRPHADAVEISMLLSGRAPLQLDAAEHIRRLRQNQDPQTGLTPELGPDGRLAGPPIDYTEGESQYHVLSLGYALDLLGSRFEHPVRAVAAMNPDDILDFCEAQPWTSAGWSSGAAIDSLGTALLWNLSRADADETSARRALDTLVGWLLSHASRDTGMWTAPRLADGLLQSVNGFYRASRGTLAQFGLPLPYPQRVIDTVFDQIADDRHFGPGRTTACNALDVAHPLWLAVRQTHHRRDEIRVFAAETLERVLAQWVPHAGFPFQFPPLSGPRTPEQVPGFKGTEMWLATVWYLADLVGIAESAGYRPRGVHRPEPAHEL